MKEQKKPQFREQRKPQYTDTVYIGNLNYKMDKDQISKLFMPYGYVRYVKIIVDPKTLKSKGIAFVQLGKKEDSDKAIAGLDGTIIGGRTVKVSMAQNQDNLRNPLRSERAPAVAKAKIATDNGEGKSNEAKPSEAKSSEATPKRLRRRDKKSSLDKLFTYLNK